MTSIELVHNIDRLLATLGEKELWTIVKGWAEFFAKHRAALFHILIDSNMNANDTVTSHNGVKQYIPNLKSPKMAKVNGDIRATEIALSAFLSGDAGISEFEEAVLTTDMAFIRRFEDRYEDFVKDQHSKNAALLLDAAEQLNAWYQNLTMTLQLIRRRLIPEETLEEGTDRLTIVFVREFDLGTLAELLHAIRAFFDASNTLLGYEDPPKIVKLETGSAWLTVAALTPVIRFAKFVLLQLRPTFTIASQLDVEKRKLAHMNGVRKAINQMKKDGLNVDVAEEKLATGAEALVESMNRINQMQPRILVDARWIDPSAEPTGKVTSTLDQPPEPRQLT